MNTEPHSDNGRVIELELVLIRHGPTQWNAERRYLGHTDLPLLPDSGGLLLRLKEQLAGYESFKEVWCSDLLRCRQTLTAVASPLAASAVYDQRLREMNFGEWEGCNYEQLKDQALYRNWIDDPAAFTPPGGESWAQFSDRVAHFLDSLEVATGVPSCSSQGELCQPRRVLVVTHGGVIRQLLALTRTGTSFREAIAPPLGSLLLLRLQWNRGRWSERADLRR
ncbi:histidine phosphatase family protein [Paenibacillus sp. GCM10012306]|uniref:histidine phosphatase family protein n=1 Tax=Paenibacillus sp. GCM10012306 TaxID=3317342 RepID=UPI0036061166